MLRKQTQPSALDPKEVAKARTLHLVLRKDAGKSILPPVDAPVLCLRGQNNQVLRVVILGIPVDVMHNLKRLERPSLAFSCDLPVRGLVLYEHVHIISHFFSGVKSLIASRRNVLDCPYYVLCTGGYIVQFSFRSAHHKRHKAPKGLGVIYPPTKRRRVTDGARDAGWTGLQYDGGMGQTGHDNGMMSAGVAHTQRWRGCDRATVTICYKFD